ncbi:hypothetical protein AVEN_239683-1 [Araneus ventricosus]|uniref:Uncharacterized protein n=1 Tax=Araneus ventricosus TaxID=182803 RepID=A0A4Y2CSZ8_ARAVE|nr:hypothetical protein AVEN_239683-1 [Araneus ventricosus]
MGSYLKSVWQSDRRNTGNLRKVNGVPPTTNAYNIGFITKHSACLSRIKKENRKSSNITINMGVKMSHDYPEETSDHVAFEISTDEESKSCTSESEEEEEEEIALNHYQKVSKQYVNHFKKRTGRYSKNGAIVYQDDFLNRQEYLGKRIKVQTVESFAQTDNVENTVAVQADIIPNDHFQKNQFVQTDEKYLHEGDSVYSDQDWGSNKSEYSDSSNFAVSETHPFTKVMALSSIPITMKHQQDYVGDLEEKTYRVSRWLHENIDSSDSGSGLDFAAKTPQVNDLTKKVSFCKTISPTIPPMHHFHWNAVAQTEYSREDDSIDSVQGSDATKQSDYHISEWQRKNFQNRFGQNDVFFNKIDYDMLVKVEEVKRELLSKTPKVLKPSKTISDEDLKPNCYKTMNETPGSPAKEEDQFLKHEQVKVRKRFSNYLKGQYRNLSEDTMGKSYMMMQDLKDVLRKRGISN